VLGVEGIADDDDFFDIGGTSLLSVRLFMLIGDLMDAELPLSTILEAPTIAQLAALIENPGHRADPLVLIRPGLEGPPLFFVHSIWGDVLGMRQMALAIETDVPIYGLRARGVNPGEEPQRTVEEMARTQVDAIRDFQPDGPYLIAGHSFGGLVAFEIARQMIELGEEVGWLGILDAELNDACLPLGMRWRYRLALPRHLARAALADPRKAARVLFRDALPNLFRRILLRIFPNAPIDPPRESWMEEALPRHRYLARICIEASADFRPKAYAGSMTYFVPEVRRLHLFPDPLPVWRRVTEGEVTVEPVPGPHVGMDSGVYGQFIAGRIDAHLGGSGQRQA
jgi:acetoacetyl-CoA synthetase